MLKLLRSNVFIQFLSYWTGLDFGEEEFEAEKNLKQNNSLKNDREEIIPKKNFFSEQLSLNNEKLLSNKRGKNFNLKIVIQQSY